MASAPGTYWNWLLCQLCHLIWLQCFLFTCSAHVCSRIFSNSEGCTGKVFFTDSVNAKIYVWKFSTLRNSVKICPPKSASWNQIPRSISRWQTLILVGSNIPRQSIDYWLGMAAHVHFSEDVNNGTNINSTNDAMTCDGQQASRINLACIQRYWRQQQGLL